MKNDIVAVTALVFLVLIAGSAFGRNEIALVSFARTGTAAITDKQLVVENQVKPIASAFGFDGEDIRQLEECAASSSISCENSIVVSQNFSIPESDMMRLDYSVERDGIELNNTSDTVQLGDTVVFRPVEYTPEIPQQQSDWIAQGALIDSPPIEIVGIDQYKDINRRIAAKFNSRYPCSDFCISKTPPFEVEVPVFSTGKTTIRSGTQSYSGDFGTAYVVQMSGGKRAGIQMICSMDPDYTGIGCESENGKISCFMDSVGEKSIYISNSMNCIYYVDTLIEGEEATKANWYTELSSRPARSNKTIQVRAGTEKAPVAEFYCEILENQNYHGTNATVLRCDASNSYDPDGSALEYEWDNLGYGGRYSELNSQEVYEKVVHYSNQPAYSRQISVTLKVINDKGFYAKKTKTISITAEPQIEFLADHQNQKALLTLNNCPLGTTQADIDIDIIGVNGEPTRSVLEKQFIQCGQTTEIGPITVKGGYQVTAQIGDFEEKAFFAVNLEN